MKSNLLPLLRCPACRSDLVPKDLVESDGEIEHGQLVCADCSVAYPIVNFVPRFVPAANYAGNFGFQWNEFRRTQLDSFSGTEISRTRFTVTTGWTPEELRGRRVLDVGCGAGRFTEIALSCGAEVVALDYSSAVDACWANHREHPSLHVVQGDIYSLPFRPEQFDFVYCMGVLQHTPDVKGAFFALPEQVRPGGRLAVDVYPKFWGTVALSKYWIRPVTRRMDPQRLFRLVQRAVPVLLPLSILVGRIPRIGRKLRHLIPVSNYDGVYPLDSRQLREWAVLDTFDALAPVHDHPQSEETLLKWFERAGLRDIEVFRHGHIVGRAVK